MPTSRYTDQYLEMLRWKYAVAFLAGAYSSATGYRQTADEVIEWALDYAHRAVEGEEARRG